MARKPEFIPPTGSTEPTGSTGSTGSSGSTRAAGAAGGRPGGISLVGAENFSFEAAIGGPRGLAESVIPYTVFSVVYGITKDLQPALIAAIVPVVILTIWRLIARESLGQVFSGAVGIALGAYLANKTGNASTFFLPNILKNAGFAAAYLLSILVRWPLIGVIAGPLLGEMMAWRQSPARYAAYRTASWIWVAMFVIRLAVQIPLALAEKVTLLGLLNALVLGFPLFALVVWLCWLVLKSVPLALPPSAPGTGDDAPEPAAADPAAADPAPAGPAAQPPPATG